MTARRPYTAREIVELLRKNLRDHKSIMHSWGESTDLNAPKYRAECQHAVDHQSEMLKLIRLGKPVAARGKKRKPRSGGTAKGGAK